MPSPRGVPTPLLLTLLLLLQFPASYESAAGEDATGQALDLDPLRPNVWSKDWLSTPCQLPAGSGRPSGVCTDDLDTLRSNLSFCGEVIRYRACVPAQQPLWPSWDAFRKDQMLAELFKNMVERRLAQEMNNSPDAYVEAHYLANPGCSTALRNALCWYNFPKCDDNNNSLPLCRSSCEQYYSKCDYQPSAADSLFDACRADRVAVVGLFDTGPSGRDQQLAEDTSVCRSTEALVDSLEEEVVVEGPWLLSPVGLVVLVLSGLLVAVLCSCPQMPPRLREILLGWLRTCLCWPVERWKKMSYVKGATVVAFSVIVLLVIAIVGLFRQFAMNMTVARFLPEEEEQPVVANSSRANASDDVASGFVPPEAIWRFPGQLELTMGQVKQLYASCTCTGAAARSVPSPWLVLVLLWASAAMAATAAPSLAGRGPRRHG